MKSRIKNYMFKLLPIDKYLQLTYLYYHRKKLDIKRPKRYTEKLYWLKKYYQNNQKDLLTKIYDKYNVREYICKKLGNDEYLPKLYGVYDSVEEIPFDKFPNDFILKITQGSGTNIISRGNESIDRGKYKEKLEKWLNEARDLNLTRKRYNEDSVLFNGDAKIICEELLMNEDKSIPDDIRFFCFNGKPRFFCVDFDSVDERGEKKSEYYRNTYSLNGELIDVNLGRPNNSEFKFETKGDISKMISIASKLSEDFIFVRIDMFIVNDKIYCGEITPIPQGGSGVVSPDSFDYKFGEFMKLPK